MLKSKELNVRWHYTNREYYEEKGYLFTKNGDTFIVPIRDAHSGSGEVITYVCDYCGKEKSTDYGTYLRSRNSNEYIKKDSCSECAYDKKREIQDYKQDKGLLTIKDRGYWSYKENILNELNNYIKINNNIINIKNDSLGRQIYEAISETNLKIDDLIKELNYNIDIVKFKQIRYIESEENLINLIDDFLNKYKRFPTYKDFKNEYGISSHCLKQYGGIDKVKELYGWDSKQELIDDNGWYNKSSYEFIVAQYLINQGISYKREQFPFPKYEGDYRSDFTFETCDGRKIYCEVWGFEHDDYIKTKNIKIELYKKYKIELISLNHELFLQPYERTQEDLYNIFKNYFNLKFVKFENEKIIPISGLSDEQIFQKLIEHSIDGVTLPTVKYLKKNHIYMLYYIAFLRYGSYQAFADKFFKNSTRIHGDKNKDKKLFEIYLDIINEFGYIPNKSVIEKRKEYKRSLSLEYKNGGKIGSKLKFYEYCIENNISLPKKEIEYLSHIFDGKDKKISNYANNEQQIKAKQILERYKSTK